MELTELARRTLEEALSGKGKEFEPDEKTKQKYSEEKASFVTLNTVNSNGEKELRGCIGSLEPEREVPLWKNVMKNAKNAAFNDPRFPSIETEEELEKIKIEVSVLSKPQELEFSSSRELLEKINKDMGLILKKGPHQGTFLPQVWEELPEKENFMDYLCLKAGLNPDEWKKNPKEIYIWYYTVEKFEE